MNGKRVALTVLAIVGIAIAGVCIYVIFKGEDEKYKFDNIPQELVNPNKENVVGSFVDVDYERTTDADTEIISFNSDGTFSYYCACGNPVDLYDLCEYYTYDEENQMIKLVCEDDPNIISELKISEITPEKLVLDFYGELREFKVVTETE